MSPHGERCKDGENFELLYIRPVNSRIEDQAMRNQSTQYVSAPGYGWKKLREEHPWVYESYVDLEPGNGPISRSASRARRRCSM
jgi:hypothetical protein